ncbi:MAG: 1-acyl-sn-glycerol-3-phosphate acyltransferase [Candidatus Poseidoniales archaeon]
MAKKTVQSGDDGAVDHHGDILPPLSKSASRIDVAKIERRRRHASNSGEHPGVSWFYNMVRGLCRMALKQQFRTIEVTGKEHISEDAGILTVAWHTNALIDSATIFVTQPKRLVFGARHDLLTRPLIGNIASISGTQPVIRQAERARGGASGEAANRINSKTMLTLAECIATGNGSALFPEGTSHEDSKMRRLRTGPMRSVIAANSISHEKGTPTPHLLPVGLHYRVSWFFRTDAWFEYGAPISLDGAIHPEEERKQLLDGEWLEAPADRVNALRDKVRERLAPMTPDAETWDEHRAWHVLGHLRAIARGNRLNSWREEVLAARSIRDEIRNGDKNLTSKQEAADRVGHKLHSVGLDGRALDSSGLRNPSIREHLAVIPAIMLAILTVPLTLFGSGLMIVIAKVLGDNTDEGLDARTTYHFLAAMLGPMIVWPLPITAFILFAAFGPWALPYTQIILIAILLPFAFHLSNKISLVAWDLHIIARNARKIGQLNRSSENQAIVDDTSNILAALK